jgi:hypothetical protein
MKENDLINEGVVSEFGTRLRLFHYLSDQPLTKKAFEFQLCRTLNNNQIKCAVTENSTLPGADLVLEGSNQKICLHETPFLTWNLFIDVFLWRVWVYTVSWSVYHLQSLTRKKSTGEQCRTTHI